ncbi:hypothetical protein CLOM_g7798 [Closterium sp. NIES-68]|nr:hypothetical protein CLOM_g7798 [Closterium sp. NIES-68]GJP59886.1 hypothetical protein CLOP_g15678 [Closterium sp. NIES-67]
MVAGPSPSNPWLQSRNECGDAWHSLPTGSPHSAATWDVIDTPPQARSPQVEYSRARSTPNSSSCRRNTPGTGRPRSWLPPPPSLPPCSHQSPAQPSPRSPPFSACSPSARFLPPSPRKELPQISSRPSSHAAYRRIPALAVCAAPRATPAANAARPAASDGYRLLPTAPCLAEDSAAVPHARMNDAEAAGNAGDDEGECGDGGAEMGKRGTNGESGEGMAREGGGAEQAEQREAERTLPARLEEWRLPARLEDGGRALLRRVRRGGCPPYMRNDVWPLLLGIHALSSTEEERAQQRRAQGACYQKLRMCARILSNLHRQSPSDRAAVTAVVSHVWTTVSAARPALAASHAAPSHAPSHAHSPTTLPHSPNPPHLHTLHRQAIVGKGGSPCSGGRGNGAPCSASPDSRCRGTSSENEGGDGAGNRTGSRTGLPTPTTHPPTATTRTTVTTTTSTSITSPQPSPSPVVAASPASAPLVLHDPVALLADFGAWQRAIRLDAMRLSAHWNPFWGTGDGDDGEEGGEGGGEARVAWAQDRQGAGGARGAGRGAGKSCLDGGRAGGELVCASAPDTDVGLCERNCSNDSSYGSIISMSSIGSSRSNSSSSGAEWCAQVHEEEEAVEAALDEVQLGEEEGLMRHTAAQRMHVARVVAVLEAYTLVDPEVGYCQGMCDVAAPFVATMPENADAFAAFFAFMHGRWWSTAGSCTTNHSRTPHSPYQHHLSPSSPSPSHTISSPFTSSPFSSFRPSSSTQCVRSPYRPPSSTSLFPSASSSSTRATQGWSPKLQGGVRRLGAAIVPLPHRHQRPSQQQQLSPHQLMQQQQQQHHSSAHWSPGGGTGTPERWERSGYQHAVKIASACHTGNSSSSRRILQDTDIKTGSSRLPLQRESFHHAARPPATACAYPPFHRATSLPNPTTPAPPLSPATPPPCPASCASPPDVHGMRLNFLLDESGIHRQLAALGRILRLADPELYGHLRDMGGGDCLFAYRMVVVGMRRDLPLAQTLLLWEVCWADALAAAMVEGAQEQQREQAQVGKEEEGKQLACKMGMSSEQVWVGEVSGFDDHKENVVMAEGAADYMDGRSGYGNRQPGGVKAPLTHTSKVCTAKEPCVDGRGLHCCVPVISPCLLDKKQQGCPAEGEEEEELGSPTGSLLLFVVVVLICSQRNALLECEGLDEILLLCHGVTKQNNLDLRQVIAEARLLAVRLYGCW